MNQLNEDGLLLNNDETWNNGICKQDSWKEGFIKRKWDRKCWKIYI